MSTAMVNFSKKNESDIVVKSCKLTERRGQTTTRKICRSYFPTENQVDFPRIDFLSSGDHGRGGFPSGFFLEDSTTHQTLLTPSKVE